MLSVDVPDYVIFSPRCTFWRAELPHIRADPAQGEGELSICLNKTQQGPVVTVSDVYAATEYVVPSIEIVDIPY